MSTAPETGPNEEVAALLERIRVLEAENELLTERSEDMLLLGIIAEGLPATESPHDVLEYGLERISMLKSIPYCAAYLLAESGPVGIAAHCSLTNRRTEADEIPPPPESLRTGGAEPTYLGEDACMDLMITLPCATLRPTSALGLPIVRVGADSFLFVFADVSEDDHLASQTLLLHRVVEMLVHRIEALELMSRLQQVNEEVSQANLALNAATRAKSEFLSLISHEIRTPMNAILGFAQLMARDEDLSDAQKERLDIINRNGEYLLALINDVLEMSKIEAGRITVTPAPFDLPAMLRDLDAVFRDRTAPGVFLRFVIQEGLPRYVVTDRAKLRQILVNLLANAVKFTHQGSVTLEVGFTAGQDDCELHFAVNDTGVGIDLAEMSLLFEPFAQTESGRTLGSGTGLGLPISKQYVELLGGMLRATSARGHGSHFEFTIRAGLGDPLGCGSAAPEVAVAPPMTRKPRVLVADDFAEMRALLREMLSGLGYDVVTASDGGEALRLFEEAPPDLLLLDMRMPVMDGVEVLRAVRTGERAPETPVVFLTASAFSDTRAQLLDAGADGFLGKPCTEAELSSIVAELIMARESNVDASARGAGHPVPKAPEAQPVDELLAADIRLAALTGDFDRVAELCGVVAEADPVLAQRLRDSAAEFDTDAVIALLDAAK